MWDGAYHFFDYKYNIAGYGRQDYDGPVRTWYLIFCVVTIVLLLILLRNLKHKHVQRYLRVLAFVMPLLEVTKITWETYWDVTTGRGFNWLGLLPIYTCSVFLYCLPVAAFNKGKAGDCCRSWIASLGLVGGLSNIIFPQGLRWYPLMTFGAMYSLSFHYIMVFTALFIVVTEYKRFTFRDILTGFVPHLLFSIPVIAIDYIFGWDYMQYYEAGSVPLIEDLSERFVAQGMRWLTALVMLAAYFALHAALTSLYALWSRYRASRRERLAAAESSAPVTVS